MSRPPQEIIDWALVMEAYGAGLGRDLRQAARLFRAGVLVPAGGLATIAHWRERPMTMSQACQAMKSGSNRTREERIKKAVDDGFLVKERAGDDGRAALVRPTEKLEALMIGHLQRTRQIVLDALKDG
jgi:DNA-binding MarR family transcriptional regulator